MKEPHEKGVPIGSDADGIGGWPWRFPIIKCCRFHYHCEELLPSRVAHSGQLQPQPQSIVYLIKHVHGERASTPRDLVSRDCDDLINHHLRRPLQDPAYQLLGCAPGREVARLFFPRSCLNRLMEPYAVAAGLWREQGQIGIEIQHRLTPSGGASVYYHLDPDLSLKRMIRGSSFDQSHNQLLATHVLAHSFSRTEEAALRNITYLFPSRAVAK
jgi:hypothetical protein